MKVKKVLDGCVSRLGLKPLPDEEDMTESERELAASLTSCLNTVLKEIAAEYLPNEYEQCITVKDGKIYIDELDRRFLYPLSIVYAGRRRRIKTYPSHIATDFSGEGLIRYACKPDDVSADGDIEDERLTENILCDGVLGEYYFINKVFDLAKSHDTRYRSALMTLRIKGRNIRLKDRRWWT